MQGEGPVTEIDACHVRRPVALVTHSYGGFISLLAASQDRRIAGLVMVDANVSAFFDQAEVDAILAEYRPQYAELGAPAPKLVLSMIPLMEAIRRPRGDCARYVSRMICRSSTSPPSIAE